MLHGGAAICIYLDPIFIVKNKREGRAWHLISLMEPLQRVFHSPSLRKLLTQDLLHCRTIMLFFKIVITAVLAVKTSAPNVQVGQTVTRDVLKRQLVEFTPLMERRSTKGPGEGENGQGCPMCGGVPCC